MNKNMETTMDDFALFGRDLFGDHAQPPQAPLAERFMIPPFSVLDARQGEWQERKRAWLSLGIQSGVGRDAVSYTIGDKATWEAEKALTSISKNLAPGGGGGGCWRGGPKTNSSDNFNNAQTSGSGTSVFDPVLCELAYRWFCHEGGQIVDPFAGGSVRGIVAALLGFDYWGCDLRAEQIAANEHQGASICTEPFPSWHLGDAMELLETAPPADLIFTCPPYGDLERYSDDPADLSTMEYHTFLAAFKRIILRCSQKLKRNGMACIVVGDFRDKKTGNYRGFVADTINAFREVGMHLYNDAILVTSIGSLPIRIGRQFDAGRKLGKTHQNVLVFRK